MQTLERQVFVVAMIALACASNLPHAYGQGAIPPPATPAATPAGSSTGAIPQRQQATTGTQMQEVTDAVGVTMDSRGVIIEGTGYIVRKSLDEAGRATLDKTSKVF